MGCGGTQQGLWGEGGCGGGGEGQRNRGRAWLSWREEGGH